MTAPVPAALQAAADAAFEYGYPLTEVMRVCDLHPAVNRLDLRRRLSTSASRNVIRPNNDTLYGGACAYLGAGSVEISMPPAHGRYMSVQVFDAYSNTVALFGPREVPAGGARYLLHLLGTSRAGLPDGAPVVEVGTPYAYVLFRTLVNGPSDLAAALAVHGGAGVRAVSADAPSRPPRRAAPTPAQEFFETLMLRLAQNPPPASEAALVASFATAGIHPSMDPSTAGAPPESLAAWESAYARGFEKLDREEMALRSPRGTWTAPDPRLATPGSNYALRALTARFGLFALPPRESVYLSTGGDARVAHVLHLPAGWPPIDPRGFWSLTMYDEHGFLVENTIHRYALGDRTPGIRRRPDGSLSIYIQCDDPGGERTANWLPAPCGRFAVMMRLYLPTAAALAPSFTLPPLE
jgi:hypothetical protein